MQKNRLFPETFADDVDEETGVKVGEHLAITVYIEGREPKWLFVHMGDDLSSWWEESCGAVPVVGSDGLVIGVSSREARPNIGLGECVDEAAVGEGFDHIDSTSVDPCDECESGDMFGEVGEIVGIFFKGNIMWKCFLGENIVEEIGVVIDNRDFFGRESLRRLVDNPPPSRNREVPEFFDPDEETDARLGSREIIIVERFDMIIDEISKLTVDSEGFFDDFYVALDEILVKIMNIRVYEGDVEDVRPPENIRSRDNRIVELFVLEDSREVTTSHIEEKYLLVPIRPMCPSECKCPVEEIHMFPDHSIEFWFVIGQYLWFLDNMDTIFCIFEVLEEEVILYRCEDNNLRIASVCSEPLYEQANEWFRNNRIPDTIGAIKINSLEFFIFHCFWLFHPYNTHPEPDPDMTRNLEQEEMNVEEKIFEHSKYKMND